MALQGLGFIGPRFFVWGLRVWGLGFISYKAKGWLFGADRTLAGKELHGRFCVGLRV